MQIWIVEFGLRFVSGHAQATCISSACWWKDCNIMPCCVINYKYMYSCFNLILYIYNILLNFTVSVKVPLICPFKSINVEWLNNKSKTG